MLTEHPVFAIVTECNDINTCPIIDFCTEIASLAKNSNCLFYVTTIPLLLENTPIGYLFRENGWNKEFVPLPTVVHNRIHSRKLEYSKSFQTFTNFLKEHNIPFFNDHFLHKWEIHKKLMSFIYIYPYLPKTILIQRMADLEEMLQDFETIFLKPIYGSQGRNIFRIYNNRDIFTISNTSFEEKQYNSLPALYGDIQEHIAKTPFVIQQGLELLTFDDRPLDFRILLHKKLTEKWSITSMVARISAKGTFVSNIAKGGELKKIQEVLDVSFNYKEGAQVKKFIKELAIEVAKCIDSSFEGLYAEFGIDIGLDTDGNPWIIEVNTKPSKNLHGAQTTAIRPSSKAIFTYFEYLVKKLEGT
jgi:glutathione synthase/RimK-type ligase-like ATP-grasp enzyme